MNFTSASDIKYNQAIDAAFAHFGKDIVTRQELIEYQESTGARLPAKFWGIARVGRGAFTLSRNPAQTSAVVSVEPDHKPIAKVVQMEHARPAVSETTKMISKFVLETMIPKISDIYVEWGNYKTLEKLVKSSKFFTLYITGESGSGKNEMVSQVCAKLHRPMVRVSITRDTKEEHLIGSKTLVDGTIVYEEGPVVWAAKQGAVLVLDELSCIDANDAMVLQNVLEGKPFFVKAANEMIVPAAGFCVIATDNTKGRGSDSGRYIGTNILNDAFLERFEMTMEQGYPNEKIERKIIDKLMERNGLTNDAFATRLSTWVQAIRKTYQEEGIEDQITTRRATHIVNTFAKLDDAEMAIKLCIARFDETTAAAMLSLWEKLEVQAAPAVTQNQSIEE